MSRLGNAFDEIDQSEFNEVPRGVQLATEETEETEEAGDSDDDLDSVIDGNEDEEENTEADRRLKLAGYYRQLTKTQVFQDGSDEATLVSKELRGWANRQMEKLVGMRSEEEAVVAAKPIFDEDEVTILRAMVNRIKEQRGIRTATPQVAVVAPPTPVKMAPVLARKPAPIQQPQPSRKVVKPVAKPVKKAAAKTKVEPESVPTDQVFEDGGKLFKWVPHPTDSERRLKINVTRQVSNPHALPMPQGQAGWGAATAAVAGNQIDTAMRGAAGQLLSKIASAQ